MRFLLLLFASLLGILPKAFCQETASYMSRDRLHSIASARGGGYLVAGIPTTGSPESVSPSDSMSLRRFRADGQMLWHLKMKSRTHRWTYVFSDTVHDRYYLLPMNMFTVNAVYTAADTGSLYCLDGSGQLLWGIDIVAPDTGFLPTSVAFDTAGRIWMAGVRNAMGMEPNGFGHALLVLAPDGRLLWCRKERKDILQDYMVEVAALNDGSVCYASGGYRQIRLARLDASGALRAGPVHYKTPGIEQYQYGFSDLSYAGGKLFLQTRYGSGSRYYSGVYSFTPGLQALDGVRYTPSCPDTGQSVVFMDNLSHLTRVGRYYGVISSVACGPGSFPWRLPRLLLFDEGLRLRKTVSLGEQTQTGNYQTFGWPYWVPLSGGKSVVLLCNKVHTLDTAAQGCSTFAVQDVDATQDQLILQPQSEMVLSSYGGVRIRNLNLSSIFQPSVPLQIVCNSAPARPRSGLGRDTSACADSMRLFWHSEGNCIPVWSTGESASSILVHNSGTYWAQESGRCANGFTISDTIHVTLGRKRDITASLQAHSDSVYSVQTSDSVLSWTAVRGIVTRRDSKNTIHVFWQAYDTTQKVLVRILGTGGCDTVFVSHRIPPVEGRPFIPNIVTPNGDDRNAVFSPKDIGLRPWSLRIFSLWGAPVFESSSYEDLWPSADVSAGLYYYYLTAQDGKHYTGWVEVVKK